jgi:hypothetical protein
MKLVARIFGCLFLLVGITQVPAINSGLGKLSIATPVECMELYVRLLGSVFTWFVACLCLIASSAPHTQKPGSLASAGKESPVPPGKPFAVSAAEWGLAFIFIAIGFVVLEGFVFREPNRWLSQLCWLALITGIGLSVIGLNGARFYVGYGLLAKSITGVVFSGLYLWIFVSLHDLARNVDVGHQMVAALRELNTEAGTNTALETRQSMSAERMLQIREIYAKAIKESTGDSQRMLKASAVFHEQMERVVAEQEKIVVSLEQMSDFGGVQSREDLARRRELVKEHQKGLGQALFFLEKGPDIVRNEMVKQGIDPRLANRVASQVRHQVRPSLRELVLLQLACQRWARNLLAVISHLESHWGSWSYDESSDLLRFSNASVAEEFDRLSARLQRSLTSFSAAPAPSVGK